MVIKNPKKNALKQTNDNNINILYKYCKNIDQWPHKWEIDQDDIKVGKALLEEFKSFLIDLINKGRAKKTIKNYADYLWVLGGELIRQINDEPDERKLSTKNFIKKHVNESGGPYWCHAYNEADHDRYDSVCRKFYKFLTMDSR